MQSVHAGCIVADRAATRLLTRDQREPHCSARRTRVTRNARVKLAHGRGEESTALSSCSTPSRAKIWRQGSENSLRSPINIARRTRAASPLVRSCDLDHGPSCETPRFPSSPFPPSFPLFRDLASPRNSLLLFLLFILSITILLYIHMFYFLAWTRGAFYRVF